MTKHLGLYPNDHPGDFERALMGSHLTATELKTFGRTDEQARRFDIKKWHPSHNDLDRQRLLYLRRFRLWGTEDFGKDRSSLISKADEICDHFGYSPNSHLRQSIERYLKDPDADELQVYLHHILLSDRDRSRDEDDGDSRDLHDHPWDFAVWILSGAYDERTPEGVDRHDTGSFREQKATQLHRVEELHGDVWTLFVCEAPRRGWGFQTRFGWQHHEDYLSGRDDPNDQALEDPDSLPKGFFKKDVDGASGF